MVFLTLVFLVCLQRANTMDEILQGIRIIKYFAWEKSFIQKVQEVSKLQKWCLLIFFKKAIERHGCCISRLSCYSSHLRFELSFVCDLLVHVMDFPCSCERSVTVLAATSLTGPDCALATFASADPQQGNEANLAQWLVGHRIHVPLERLTYACCHGYFPRAFIEWECE
jgi:hypothetical protein